MINLGFNSFVQKYGPAVFDSFQCPYGMNLLLFSQLCIHNYTDICKILEIRAENRNTKDESNQCNDLPKKSRKYFQVHGTCADLAKDFGSYNWPNI